MNTWRRFHGDSIADVIGMWPTRYRVVISNTTSGVVRELPKGFLRLDAAKAAADDAVRHLFAHKCGTDSCGGWLIWSA
jgi:hypothetical protein